MSNIIHPLTQPQNQQQLLCHHNGLINILIALHLSRGSSLRPQAHVRFDDVQSNIDGHKWLMLLCVCNVLS